MRCAAFAAAASCSGVSRRSSASLASAVSCSAVLTSGFSSALASFYSLATSFTPASAATLAFDPEQPIAKMKSAR